MQAIATYGGDPTPLGGSFTLEFGGYISGDLPYDASADGFKAALEALPALGRVEVDKIVSDNGRSEWLVTFRCVRVTSNLLCRKRTTFLKNAQGEKTPKPQRVERRRSSRLSVSSMREIVGTT